ncbi:hypothetical protein ACQBAU_07995 [Propionibacteriaceae bacterium Y2011]
MRNRGGLLKYAWVVAGMACGVLLTYLGIRDGHPTDVLVGVVIIAVCVLLSPPVRQLIARRVVANRPRPDTDAPVVIYWRSDDLPSLKLRAALRDVRDRAVWINTWYHEWAEATVRQQHRGDEILPMVMVNGVPHTSPAPDVVRHAIEQAAAGDAGE